MLYEDLNTPILLIIFNRPEMTLKTLSAISKVRPKVLLLAADGPRNEEEKSLCDATKALVLDNIHWPCEVISNFSDKNLGCGLRVHTAIDWAFSLYEQLIIMEDDCIAHPSFFNYCEVLLDYYRDNDKVMHIGGNNFQDKSMLDGIDDSYYFSKYPHVWGWATWRRAWANFDFETQQWSSFQSRGGLDEWCADRFEYKYWYELFNDVNGGKIDTWDYQWVLACWANDGLCIVPRVNLVSNIGFGEDATHTKERNVFLERDTKVMKEINHPNALVSHKAADRITFDQNFGGAQMRHDAKLLVRIKVIVRRALSDAKQSLIRLFT